MGKLYLRAGWVSLLEDGDELFCEADADLGGVLHRQPGHVLTNIVPWAKAQKIL